MKYKVGDKVACVYIINDSPFPKGNGWEFNKVFTIVDVLPTSRVNVFKLIDNNGKRIYSEYVVPFDPFDMTQLVVSQKYIKTLLSQCPIKQVNKIKDPADTIDTFIKRITNAYLIDDLIESIESWIEDDKLNVFDQVKKEIGLYPYTSNYIDNSSKPNTFEKRLKARIYNDYA